MSNQKSLTRAESRRLGRSEYFNSENEYKTCAQCLEKYRTNGVFYLWTKEFENGFYEATALSDFEFEMQVSELVERGLL